MGNEKKLKILKQYNHLDHCLEVKHELLLKFRVAGRGCHN
uniref:Uncharacterized protein n=1 Tax=Romanomermis culicivorax TaxID=13658 RepID=A0A915I7T7_ROMCU